MCCYHYYQLSDDDTTMTKIIFFFSFHHILFPITSKPNLTSSFYQINKAPTMLLILSLLSPG